MQGCYNLYLILTYLPSFFNDILHEHIYLLLQLNLIITIDHIYEWLYNSLDCWC